MRKEIVLLLVAAVLILGGAAVAFDSVAVISCNISIFDPPLPGGPLVTPDGDDLPDGSPL
jgi:hypothetical protein